MKKRRNSSFLFKVGVMAFAVYAAFTIFSLQLKIKDKKNENIALQTSLDTQKLKNAEIEEIIVNASDTQYLARIARDKLGYISPGEKVYVNPSK